MPAEIPSDTPASPSPDRSIPGEPLDIRTTEFGRDLAGRFGDGWRFDIVDKRRDGEDVVVWARLVVDERGHDKTRRGRVRVRTVVSDTPLAAEADGSAFVLRPVGAASQAVANDPEQAAYDEAAMLALSACVKGL